MQTRKSLDEKALHFQTVVQSCRLNSRFIHFTLSACRTILRRGLEIGYFLGLKDAEEIMAQRQLPWRTGKTNAKRILAELQWGDGANYYEVLYFHPFESLRYPGGYYDTSGENVPDSVIKKFVEF